MAILMGYAPPPTKILDSEIKISHASAAAHYPIQLDKYKI
jgi:hypothetical protein